jgi:hypothetical protein
VPRAAERLRYRGGSSELSARSIAPRFGALVRTACVAAVALGCAPTAGACSSGRRAVASEAPAASTPVRVAVSPDGRAVWVTARGSNSLLQFSAAKLVSEPGHALLDQIQIGVSPVGLTTFRGGTRIIVADSNRFATQDSCGSLTLGDAGRGVRDRPAPLGLIRAGRFPRDISLEPGRKVLLVSELLLRPARGDRSLEGAVPARVTRRRLFQLCVQELGGQSKCS